MAATTAWSFQLTAARRRLVGIGSPPSQAAYFNSQPREGGWIDGQRRGDGRPHFNSQPREGGWAIGYDNFIKMWISTHSRAKAAGLINSSYIGVEIFQLTAARRRLAHASY